MPGAITPKGDRCTPSAPICRTESGIGLSVALHPSGRDLQPTTGRARRTRRDWCNSTDDERLNPNNGLPLVANLDALFDSGLISFDRNGEMLVSPALHEGS